MKKKEDSLGKRRHRVRKGWLLVPFGPPVVRKIAPFGPAVHPYLLLPSFFDLSPPPAKV